MPIIQGRQRKVDERVEPWGTVADEAAAAVRLCFESWIGNS